jgi:hypothetical protein
VKIIGLTISLFFILSSPLYSQILQYDVVKGSKKLGEMRIERKLDDGLEEIKINSEVTYRILLAVTIRYKMYEKFRNGRLVWGNAISTLAGNTQKQSKIEKQGESFTLTLDGTENTWDEPILFSVSQIYFYEPEDGQRVFSQQFGRYLEFEKVDDHKYLMSSPDGDNYYTYRDGVCVDVRVIRDFARFNFKIQDSSLRRYLAQLNGDR